MNEYYAVVRSSSALSHYGVKGMRWGVRRAIKRINERFFGKRPRNPKELTVRKSNSSSYSFHESDKMKSLMGQMKKMESDFYKNSKLVDEHRKKISA